METDRPTRGERLARARERRAASYAEIDGLLARQRGVVSRAQVLDAGLLPADLERALRRREWARVHPGVFVTHTGRLDWEQRAWAALLHAAPAVLDGVSALRAVEGAARGRRRPHEDDVIHVAVAADRAVRAPAGVVIRRRRHLDDRAGWSLTPPRLHYPHAVIEVATAEAEDLDAIGRLADATGAGRTTAHQLAVALRERPRSARRDWLSAVLDDIAAGSCSVLEHGYLAEVVRPHGLPVGILQAPGTTRGRPCFRDVDLPELGLVIELDGRLHHSSVAQRDKDLDRDLEAAAEGGRRTVRLGWGQVHGRACRTAALLERLLRDSGWAGGSVPCGAGCGVGRPREGSDVPGASDPSAAAARSAATVSP